MQLEDYFDFSDPGEIRIKGHRVWIQHVLYPYVYQKRTAEQIAGDLPSLSLDEVYATILYYLRNKEIVTRYLEDLRSEAARQRLAQPPLDPDLTARLRSAKEAYRARWGAARDPELPV